MTLHTGGHTGHSGMLAIEYKAVRRELAAEAPGEWDCLHAGKWC